MLGANLSLRKAIARLSARVALVLVMAALAMTGPDFVTAAKEKRSMLEGVTECKAWCDRKHATPSYGIQQCYRKCEAYWMCNGSNATEQTCKDGRALLERSSPQLPAGMEDNTDRPGSDFGNFTVSPGSPAVCQSACRKDDRCKAWTYVRPRVHGPSAVCYLKSAMPPATPNKCCISGVVPRGPVGVSPNLPPPASQN